MKQKEIYPNTRQAEIDPQHCCLQFDDQAPTEAPRTITSPPGAELEETASPYYHREIF